LPARRHSEGSTCFLAISCRPAVLRCGNSGCLSALRTPPQEVASDGSPTVLARTEPAKAFRYRGACTLAFRAGCRCVVAHRARIRTIWTRQRTSSIRLRIPKGTRSELEERECIPALSSQESDSLAITMVVQELFSLRRSRVGTMRTARLGRSPRMIGQ